MNGHAYLLQHPVHQIYISRRVQHCFFTPTSKYTYDNHEKKPLQQFYHFEEQDWVGKRQDRLDGYRAKQNLVGVSAHCADSYIPHVQHIICMCGRISQEQ